MTQVLGFASSGQMDVFRLKSRDLEMLPQCGFVERICALEEGRSNLKPFFTLAMWLEHII